MYSIKNSDIERFAESTRIKSGKQLVKRIFFTFDQIRINENPTRYDTRIYTIKWNLNEHWWFHNETKIEVDIEDNIVGFHSTCNCWKQYNKMCEHEVCLALTIQNMQEEEKKKMSTEEYQQYEEKLLKEYEIRKQIYLEKKRAEEIEKNKNNFKKLLAEYNQLNKTVKVAEKIGLDIILKQDNGYALGFKVGASKKYIVKNVFAFFHQINNKELVKYGKNLEFFHDINNFDEDAKRIINLIQSRTSYWLSEAYQSGSSSGDRFRYITISRTLLEELLSTYTDRYITYMFNNDTKDLYISNKPFEGRLFLDEEKIVLKDVKNYGLFIGDKKSFITIDYTIHPLVGVTEILKPLYRQLAIHKKIVIKDTFNTFLKEVYPLIHDHVDIEYGFKEKHPVKEVKIDSYFDLDDGVLYLNTKYFMGEKETTIENLEKGSYSFSKLQEYQNYLDAFGFENGKTKELDRITLFLKSDLSFLKECGDVYLTETLKNAQIKKMSKVVVNLGYNLDMFSVCFNELGFTNEELYKILTEFKKKKKYVKLSNNTILELDEKNLQDFVDIIDDFDLDTKKLTEVQKKPLYIAAKALNKQNTDYLEINYDEKLKEIIKGIKNFKENEYEVPDSLKNTLRKYQVDAFKWLKTLTEYNFGGVLADDMGLGKTLEMITFILSDEKEMPSLIISPTSLIYNWKNEISKWASSLDYIVIFGNVNDRKTIISDINPKKKVIYITSYDTFKNDVDLYKDIKFRFVILDEAQFIKNYYTQKAKAVKEITSEVRFVLTGTPIENSLLDLWSIFDFLLPGYLSNHTNFKSKFEKAIVSDNSQEALNILIKKITPFVLRRTKKSVMDDLPEKFETINFAQMEEEQRKVYEAYLLSTKALLEEGRSKFEMLSQLTRLRQLCVHPALFLENYQGRSAKLELALVIIDSSISSGHKILLFSQFTSMFNTFENELKKRKIDYFVLTGATKSIDRINMVDEFNENEDIKVFLISLKAGGTGLNLTGADIVIHFDPWWNISVENQATDRAHRIGQKNSVQVIKLVCENSIEQKVIELQNLKKDIADKVISDDEGNIQKLDDRDLSYLLS